jgi:molecular chaperone DnaK
VKILVLQGESDRAEENELLGEFILTGLRAAPKGEVEIEVTFEINADGIVSVSAKDLETGQQQAITVTATSGLTEDEIKKMMHENQEYLVDMRRSEEVEKEKLAVKRTMTEIDKIFPKVRTVLEGSEFGQDAIRKAERVMDTARKAMEGNDLVALKNANEALARTLTMFKGVISKLG